MAHLSEDDAYYIAITAGIDSELLKAAKQFGSGFLYQETFAVDRSAVIASCENHKNLLLRLLAIKQTPDLSKIQRALKRYYTALGRPYIYAKAWPLKAFKLFVTLKGLIRAL